MSDADLSRLAHLGIRSLADVLPKYQDSSTNEDDREAIRETISILNSADRIRFHLSVFVVGDWDLVRRSSDALARIGSKRATRPLLRILHQSPSWHCRMFAAATLMHLEDKRAIIPLINSLENKDEDERVRDEAAEALSVFVSKRPRRVIPALLRAADDSSPWVRWSVAFSLGHSADPCVIPALERLATDETVLPGGQVCVGEEAREALQRNRRKTLARRSDSGFKRPT